MDSYRQAVIQAESRVVEHGYTLGALNRHTHFGVESNAKNPQILEIEQDHLKYVKGKGIVKIEERDCLLCIDRGLNDGKYHAGWPQ